MRSVKRRAAYYLLFVAVLIPVSTLVYHFGMIRFEPGAYPPPELGVETPLLYSMEHVIETFTATGYGSHSPWASTEMNLIVMLLDLTGVGLFFLALPAVFLPLFEEALSPSAPIEVEDGLHDHVVICTYTARAEALIAELESNAVEYVLVEPDRETAMDLRDDGYTVVNADPESVSDLEAVNLPDARALVADVSDRVDVSIVLAAKEVAEDVTVVSVVEDPDQTTYHRLAGADAIVTPRQLLGESLAQKITTAVSTDLGETVRVGEDFEVVELPIRHGSDLEGQTLAESDIRERFGVNVIGTWYNGEFETPPPLDVPLEAGTVLLATGEEERLVDLRESAVSPVRPSRRGETIVVGYGEVGQSVTGALEAADLPYTVVDKVDHDGVDIVGDGTDPDALREAGAHRAQSVVLAIPDDTTTEFATLVLRDMNEDLEIIARAETTEAVRKTYRAGGDYVLSLATVSGRSIASQVIESGEILSMDTNVELVRTSAPGLVGQTLESARIRERTACTVVGIERNGEVLTDLGPESRIESGDELVIAGTDAGTNRFTELFG